MNVNPYGRGRRQTYPPGGSQLQGMRGPSGLGRMGDLQPQGPNYGDQSGLCNMTADDALAAAVCAREVRVAFLLEHGEPFWLPTSLGLGTTPASGTLFQSTTMSVDFDLLIVGGDCTIFLSTIDIRDSARQRILTNSTTPIGALFDIQVSGTLTQYRNFWYKPYLLPARSQLAYTVTANGTESNGILTLYCLQPPTYTS